MIPEVLFLVEQVRPRAAKVDDFRASVPVLLKSRAFEAVEGIRDSLSSADHALVLIISEGAFVADTHKRRGPGNVSNRRLNLPGLDIVPDITIALDLVNSCFLEVKRHTTGHLPSHLRQFFPPFTPVAFLHITRSLHWDVSE